MGKFAQTLGYLCLALGALFFSFLTLALALSKSSNSNFPLYVFATTAFLWAYLIDATVRLAIETLKIKNRNINLLNSHSAKLSSYGFTLYEIGKIVLLLIIILGVFLPVLISLYKEIFQIKTLTYTPQFYATISGYIIYIIVRNPLAKLFNKLFNKLNAGATYTLEPKGIAIKLNFRNIGKPQKDYSIFINYDEIEQLAVMDFAEAYAYQQYQILPNIGLEMLAVKELAQYVRGDIRRPQIYINNTVSDKTLLIKGKDLLYFVTMQSNDLSDLIKAYEEYGTKHLFNRRV